MDDKDLNVPVELFIKSTDGTEKWETLGRISNEISLSITDAFESAEEKIKSLRSVLDEMIGNPKYIMRLFNGSKAGSKLHPLNAKQVVGFLKFIKRC